MSNVEKFLSVAEKARDNPADLSRAENSFLDFFRGSQFNPRIAETAKKEKMLLWDSDTSETLGCIIDQRGFLFSEVKIYDKSDNTALCNANFHFLSEKEDLSMLEKETEIIKALLMLYSEDLKNYFK